MVTYPSKSYSKKERKKGGKQKENKLPTKTVPQIQEIVFKSWGQLLAYITLYVS